MALCVFVCVFIYLAFCVNPYPFDCTIVYVKKMVFPHRKHLPTLNYCKSRLCRTHLTFVSWGSPTFRTHENFVQPLTADENSLTCLKLSPSFYFRTIADVYEMYDNKMPTKYSEFTVYHCSPFLSSRLSNYKNESLFLKRLRILQEELQNKVKKVFVGSSFVVADLKQCFQLHCSEP